MPCEPFALQRLLRTRSGRTLSDRCESHKLAPGTKPGDHGTKTPCVMNRLLSSGVEPNPSVPPSKRSISVSCQIARLLSSTAFGSPNTA